MGGGVGGFTPIIKPLCGPTCMLKTSKISTQVEIASWARVGQYERKSTNAGEQENHKRPGNNNIRTSSLTKEVKEEKRYEGKRN